MRLLACVIVFALVCWSASRPVEKFRGPASSSIIKGYNIAWFDVNYGHQWNDGSFSNKKVKELLDFAKAGDAKIVRMWLFEDSAQGQFILDETGEPIELRPEFIPNVLTFLRECKKRGLKANLTLFDGNAFEEERLPRGKKRTWWWNVFNNEYQMGQWFSREVVRPLFEAIEDEELMSVVAQIELMNEIDGAVKGGIFVKDWSSAQTFVCDWHKKMKPWGVSYGVSVGHEGAELHILNNDVPAQCTDYLDLHVYNDTGSIPQCEWFQKKAAKGQRFQLGEFGQKSANYDDESQKHLTSQFLSSAADCGFESALAWRLEDLQPGHNKESRYSYTAFGEARPAWFALRDFPGQAR